MPPTTRALLLTDVVDSTKLSEALGDERMAQAWAAHDRVARELLAGAEAIVRGEHDRGGMVDIPCRRGRCEHAAGDLAAARSHLADAWARVAGHAAPPAPRAAKAVGLLRAALDETG